LDLVIGILSYLYNNGVLYVKATIALFFAIVDGIRPDSQGILSVKWGDISWDSDEVLDMSKQVTTGHKIHGVFKMTYDEGNSGIPFTLKTYIFLLCHQNLWL
jgi:hypothetical protein